MQAKNKPCTEETKKHFLNPFQPVKKKNKEKLTEGFSYNRMPEIQFVILQEVTILNFSLNQFFFMLLLWDDRTAS